MKTIARPQSVLGGVSVTGVVGGEAFGEKWAGAGVRYMGLGLWQKIWIWGGGTRKKNKEKKGAGVGRTKLGGNRRVETRG